MSLNGCSSAAAQSTTRHCTALELRAALRAGLCRAVPCSELQLLQLVLCHAGLCRAGQIISQKSLHLPAVGQVLNTC